jgi:hypothetical protein
MRYEISSSWLVRRLRHSGRGFTNQTTTNCHRTRPGEPSEDVRRRPLTSSAHIEASFSIGAYFVHQHPVPSTGSHTFVGYIWEYGAIPQRRYPKGASRRNYTQSCAGMRMWTRSMRIPIWDPNHDSSRHLVTCPKAQTCINVRRRPADPEASVGVLTVRNT